MKNRILHSKMAITSTLALVLGVTAMLTSAWRDQSEPRLSDQLFAQKIAGAYLADQPDGSRLWVDLNVGGSVHREASFDFTGLSGAPDLPFHFLRGAFGNWTRNGPRTIRDVELNFLFGEEGQVNLIAKTQVDIEFNRDLESAAGTYVSGFYLPEQDPLTHDPALPGPSEGGLVLRRIH